MSQVYPSKYRYQVCPFCKSKNIRPVALVGLEKNQWRLDMTQVQRTGYLCENCNRYHEKHKDKFIVDRAEIKRDIAALQKYLRK